MIVFDDSDSNFYETMVDFPTAAAYIAILVLVIVNAVLVKYMRVEVHEDEHRD